MSAVNLLCSAATSYGKWSELPSAQSATRRRLAGLSSRCAEPPRAASAEPASPRLDASSICTGLEQCWVGYGDARRHISRACRDKRIPVHRSLLAAFIAQNGADLNASKCAAEAQHLFAVQADQSWANTLGRESALRDPPTDGLLINAVKVGCLPDAGAGRHACPVRVCHVR